MELTRRKFLGGLGALIGGIALEQAIPFNRVWSFPSKVVVPIRYMSLDASMEGDGISPGSLGKLMTIYYDRKALEALKRNLVFSPGRFALQS